MTLPWDKRCPLLAAVIVKSGAAVVCAQEIGATQLADLLKALGPQWQGRKASNVRGLNADIWRNDWTLAEVVLDYDLPSYGQSARTFIVCRLLHTSGVELLTGSFHTAAAAADLTRAQANIAKLAQVKVICSLTKAYPQIVLGADLARTDDADDQAYLVEQDWTLNGRSAATPQLILTRGVTSGRSITVDTGKACDHPATLTPITIQGAP